MSSTRAARRLRFWMYRKGREYGLLSCNDIRRMEGLDPVVGGDLRL